MTVHYTTRRSIPHTECVTLFIIMTFVEMLPYIQIGLGVLSTIFILLQRSEAGLGGAFGGGDSFASESGKHSRRGGEQVMFYITLFIVFSFVASVLASLFV